MSGYMTRHAEHTQEQGAVVATTRRPVVLIAEDEMPIAEALALLVEDNGYTPLLAAHGKEALALAREHQPELVITDLMMPYLNGLDLIAALRADAQASGATSPAIVLMSAARMPRHTPNGPDAYLKKPFNIVDVEQLLERFLGDAGRGE